YAYFLRQDVPRRDARLRKLEHLLSRDDAFGLHLAQCTRHAVDALFSSANGRRSVSNGAQSRENILRRRTEGEHHLRRGDQAFELNRRLCRKLTQITNKRLRPFRTAKHRLETNLSRLGEVVERDPRVDRVPRHIGDLQSSNRGGKATGERGGESLHLIVDATSLALQIAKLSFQAVSISRRLSLRVGAALGRPLGITECLVILL